MDTTKYGVLALIILIPSLFWARYQGRIAEEAEAAYASLSKSLKHNQEVAAEEKRDHLIRFLLQHERHWDYLERLDEESEQLAFRPDRHQAYLLQPRGGKISKEKKIGLTVITIGSSAGAMHSAYSGYPHYLLLESLDFDNNTLVLRGHVPDDIKWKPDVNGVQVEGGEELEFRIDLPTLRPGSFNLKELGTPRVL